MLDLSYVVTRLTFTLLIATGLSLIGTPLAMDLAQKLDIIDRPNKARKVHTKPIPYLGGVAIYVAFVVASVAFCPLSKEIAVMLGGGAILMVVGAIDDKKDLSPKLRLFVQIACAALAVIGGIKAEGINVPFGGGFLSLGVLSWPLTIIWIVAISNAMNFIDGLDGLTAGTTIIICGTLILVAWHQGFYNVLILSAAMSGACLGFLRYNFHPAKVFMGDAGTVFIGYVLGCLSVMGPMKQATLMTMLTPVIALGLPIFDMVVVMIRRIWSGKSPMSADRTHAHHRLFDSGLSQKQTVLWLYAISICFGLTAISITTAEGRIIAFVAGIVGIALFIHAHHLEAKKVNERPTLDLTNQL